MSIKRLFSFIALVHISLFFFSVCKKEGTYWNLSSGGTMIQFDNASFLSFIRQFSRSKSFYPLSLALEKLSFKSCLKLLLPPPKFFLYQVYNLDGKMSQCSPVSSLFCNSFNNILLFKLYYLKFDLLTLLNCVK